jgi:ATP-binding cassette subfamily B multidrug efflux pump
VSDPRRPRDFHSQHFAPQVTLKDRRGTTLRLVGYLRRSLGLVVVAGLCAVAATLVTIVGTRLNGYAVDGFIATPNLPGLAAVCALLAGVYAVGAVATFVQNRIMIGVAQEVSRDLRRELFAALQWWSLGSHDKRSTGDLMSRLTNDVDNVNTMLAQGAVQFFSGFVMVGGMVVAMVLLSPVLTLVALVLVPVMIAGPRVIVKYTKASFSAQQKELGRLNGFAEEVISGQTTVALFRREPELLAEFQAINARYAAASTRAQGLSGLMGPVNNTVNNLAFLILTLVGAGLIVAGTGMTVGVVFTFLLYMRIFTRPINDIFTLFTTLQSALAGAERIFEALDEPPEADAPGAVTPGPLAGRVEFEHLSFAYVPGRPVLQVDHLEVNAGQTVAIVGPTGAGKTTIMNLLPRFYGLESGTVRIDGLDVAQMTARGLRSQISVVPQEPYLFSVSVRENLRYGRLTATDADVEAAAHQAQAHGFIVQLPQGYDTVLSDNGASLSQGQRQLLALTRALLADSSILILDEATSSIDTRTEVLIQQALLELMRGKTSFVIAHRLSTIRKADKIVFLDHGTIVEAGTHDELVARGGAYAGLLAAQLGNAEVD